MVKIGNLIDLKHKNLKSIIDYVRFREFSVKKQISLDLDLSFATVSNMTNLLTQSGLIREVDTAPGHGVGRSPKSFIFDARRYSVLVMDLHQHAQMTLYIADLNSDILKQKTYPNPELEDTARYLDILKEAYADFLDDTDGFAENGIGVGVVIPGVFDAKSDRVIGTSNAIFGEQPMRQMLAEITGKRVVLENDTNLAALFSSRTTGSRDLAYFYMGIGLGIGIITSGHILRSTQGYSSEIAHAPLGNVGRVCKYCGNVDCIQTDLSREGYLEKYTGKPLEMRDVTDGMWGGFINKVAAGDKKAVAAVEENARVMSRALSTVSTLARPDTIMVGGLPKPLADVTLPICEKDINSRKYYNPHIHIRLDEHVLQTIAQGAAEMVYDTWYPSPDDMLE